MNLNFSAFLFFAFSLQACAKASSASEKQETASNASRRLQAFEVEPEAGRRGGPSSWSDGGKKAGKYYGDDDDGDDDDDDDDDDGRFYGKGGNGGKKSSCKDGDDDDDDDDIVVPGPSISCSNQTALPTGAVLSVELDLSAVAGIGPVIRRLLRGDSSIQRMLQGMQIPIGQADITAGGQATNFLHVTYLIDVSGSTSSSCGNAAGDSVLTCQKDAILNLNTKIAQSGVAIDVGLVKFTSVGSAVDVDDDPGVQVLAPPSDPGVAAAINGLRSDGGTSFSSGLTSAISVVNQSLQNPNVLESVIVALTDGDTGSLSSITRQIAELELIGTKVFTFAIGRGSSCTETFQTLSMRTGAGNCTKVDNPSDLERVIDETFAAERTLTKVELTLDRMLVASTTTPSIPDSVGLTPDQTPATVLANLDFGSNVAGTEVEVCLKSFSRTESVQCCLNVVVQRAV